VTSRGSTEERHEREWHVLALSKRRDGRQTSETTWASSNPSGPSRRQHAPFAMFADPDVDSYHPVLWLLVPTQLSAQRPNGWGGRCTSEAEKCRKRPITTELDCSPLRA